MQSYNKLDLLRLRKETFLREICFHEELKSTNSTAIELSRMDIQTPLLVIAQRQTAGRGRGSNTWWSSEGALTFTLIIDLPMRPPEPVGPISLTAGLAVLQAIEKIAPNADLGLKWPNDVFLEGKKVCGILVERLMASEPRLVIGIGINVNNSLEADVVLQQMATSLRDELEAPVALCDVLIECLQHLEKRINDHVHRREYLLDQWRTYCLLTGRSVVVDAHGTELAGTCFGIDQTGALLIRGADDQVQRCIAGVVTSISPR